MHGHQVRVDTPFEGVQAHQRQVRQVVELKVYPDEDHGGTVLASLPDSTPFLARQFG